MRGLRWLLVVLAAVGAGTAADAGDIQVFCEPGLRVYLDGELVGTSNTREDGLVLTGVARGRHTIRVERDGFVPQSIEVEMGSFPLEVTVAALSPLPVVRERQDAAVEAVKSAVGNLVVTSAPQNCTVEVGGRTETKTTPQLLIEGLPVGEHTVRFTKDGFEPLETTVTVHPGAVVTVRGDLKGGRVQAQHQGRGSLRIHSEPQRCTIRFRGRLEDKTGLVYNQTHIPAGEYPLTVAYGGRELSTTVVILDGRRTVVEVSFMDRDQPFTMSHVPH